MFKISKGNLGKVYRGITDKDVFPEEKERFKLGSHDLSRTLRHTKMKK